MTKIFYGKLVKNVLEWEHKGAQMDFHKRLVELRNQTHLSQEQLAEKLYVSRQTISNWERGKTYPDINSLLMISVYFDVSLDYLIKGDVDIMKHQINQSQLKKWLILSGILFFAISVIFPTRYLPDSNIFSIYLPVIGMSLLYCLFQVFYTLRNNKITTFTDILNFLDEKEHPFKLSREIWWLIVFLIVTFLIFFAGVVTSTFLFW